MVITGLVVAPSFVYVDNAGILSCWGTSFIQQGLEELGHTKQRGHTAWFIDFGWDTILSWRFPIPQAICLMVFLTSSSVAGISRL